MPIESVVVVEVCVLGGNDRMLEIRRDLPERNELVAFAIRLAMNPGLQAALHVHRGGRGVDPPGRHKNQRSRRPKKHHADDKPPNKGSEETP